MGVERAATLVYNLIRLLSIFYHFIQLIRNCDLSFSPPTSICHLHEMIQLHADIIWQSFYFIIYQLIAFLIIKIAIFFPVISVAI